MVAASTPYIMSSLKRWIFLIYLVITVLGWFFVYFFLVETKDADTNAIREHYMSERAIKALRAKREQTAVEKQNEMKGMTFNVQKAFDNLESPISKKTRDDLNSPKKELSPVPLEGPSNLQEIQVERLSGGV